MVVLSEGWVQFLLAISCVLLLVISLLAVFSWLKRKKGITKAKEQAGAFLVFVTVLLIYFALSLALPARMFLMYSLGQRQQNRSKTMEFGT